MSNKNGSVDQIYSSQLRCPSIKAETQNVSFGLHFFLQITNVRYLFLRQNTAGDGTKVMVTLE